MAKIYEQTIVIKLSKLVKNNEEPTNLVNSEILAALEQVAEELLGKDLIVEVEVAG